MTNKTIVVIALLAVVLGFVAGVLVNRDDQALGGQTIYGQLNLVGDVHSGLAGTKMLSDGELVGPIDLASGNTATFPATTTISGAARVKGLTGTGVTTLGSAATISITGAQACESETLIRAPLVANSSTTLPTAVDMERCLTATGENKEVIFINTGITASSTWIAAANASTTIRVGSAGTATSTPRINGGNAAVLKFIRTANAGTMTVLLHTFLPQ